MTTTIAVRCPVRSEITSRAISSRRWIGGLVVHPFHAEAAAAFPELVTVASRSHSFAHSLANALRGSSPSLRYGVAIPLDAANVELRYLRVFLRGPSFRSAAVANCQCMQSRRRRLHHPSLSPADLLLVNPFLNRLPSPNWPPSLLACPLARLTTAPFRALYVPLMPKREGE